ncbi:MAG TPA: DUF3667 domain-containing protein [Longimicrobiales bacterium]|nr:DUF3667 domain-containing protein [Longimicrobiales bacterium]
MSSNDAADGAPADRGTTNSGERAKRWRSPEEPCLNCGDPTYGRYCPTCGQRKLEVQVSVRTMLRDVLEDQLALSGALPRTLVALLFRPGHLTNEYIRGRIVSYIAPFRLYLVASVLFFLLFSFIGLAVLERSQVNITELEAVADARSAVEEFERELADMDTAAMPEAARSSLRGAYTNLQVALAQAIADSTAAAQAIAELTGEAPPAPLAPPSPLDPERETASSTAAAADSQAARPAAATSQAATPGEGAVADPAAPDSAVADTAIAADGSVPEPPAALAPGGDRLQPWARRIRSETRFPALDRAVQRKIEQVGHLTPREAFGQVARDYIEFAPHMIFLLLPVYALLLKLLYVRRGRYYAEHFVFALHIHAFAFVTFTLVLLVPWDWIDRALLLWMIVYMWIAMRKVYGQGVVRTTVKWWVLGWSYLWVFVFGMVALAVVMLLAT